MADALLYLVSSFWLGAIHAATPGHGKTIAAAYIVGARGRPIDAWILGVFVTLSHVSGIVIVGVLASLGLPGMVPQRIEAWLALATGILIIVIGAWTLWTQRGLFPVAGWGGPHTHDHDHAHAHGHSHDHTHPHEHSSHDHSPGETVPAYHSHGFGFKHTHNVDLVTGHARPSLWLLIGLGVAGGLLPDPAALGILLNALAQGKVMLGLMTVVVFSLGFALTLVLVGVIAAWLGKRVLDWLAGPWPARLQIATSVIIMIVGITLSIVAWQKVGALA
jgi:nickel/cobalt exporter